MDGGRIADTGSHEGLLESSALYRGLITTEEPEQIFIDEEVEVFS